jgi:protein gp37
MARRQQAMGTKGYENGFAVTLRPDRLDEPLRWRKPRMVFVCSMGDLFHEDVPTSYIRRVFQVMRDAPQHTFQILTKRHRRLVELADSLPWPDHIWAGVTVENDFNVGRIGALRLVPAKVRFLSCEPLIGPIYQLPLDGIHWAIVGGESGPGFRPMDPDWARDIRDQCDRYGVPLFFKQYSAFRPKQLGHLLDGVEHREYPEAR